MRSGVSWPFTTMLPDASVVVTQLPHSLVDSFETGQWMFSFFEQRGGHLLILMFKPPRGVWG